MTAGAFLYFFPGISTDMIKREWLRASPVAEQFRDIWERSTHWGLLHRAGVNNGPAGQSGVIIAAGVHDDQNAIYQPDHQRWIDCGTHWLGVDNRFVPNAASMQRAKIVPGVETELAAGGVWVLPIIRRPSDERITPSVSCLPVVRASGRNGVAAKMPERYAAIWELTGRLLNWFCFDAPLTAGDGGTEAYLYDAAAVCLSVNYRVGAEELDALECLEDDDVTGIIRAAIAADDIDEFIAAKNRAPKESPTEAPA